MNNSQHDSLKEFLLNCILNNINLSNAMITKNRKDEFLIICDCEVAGLNEISYKRPSNQTVCMWFQENNPPQKKPLIQEKFKES